MKAKDTLQLLWSDFQTNVVDSFQNIRATQDFSDVTLACDGDGSLIEAHRIILANGSSFFQQILSSQTVQHPHPLLYLGGVRRTDLEGILDFLYHGHTNVPQVELLTFLQTAKRLGVKGLQSEEELTSAEDTNIGLEKAAHKDPIETNVRDDQELIKQPVDARKGSFTHQSPVWQFMQRLDFNTAQCKVCGMSRNCLAGTTSGLIKHIYQNHMEEALIVRNHFSLKKLQHKERKTNHYSNNVEEMQNEVFAFEMEDTLELPPEGLVTADLQVKVEEFNGDTNEEVQNKEYEDDNEDDNIKTFNPNVVLGKTPISLCWNFFIFKGTEEEGPDKSRVYCSLYPKGIGNPGVPYSGATTNLNGHLRNNHENQLKGAENSRLNKQTTVTDNSSFVEDMIVSVRSRWQCKVCAKVMKEKNQIQNHVQKHLYPMASKNDSAKAQSPPQL